MSLKDEWKKLALILAVFLACCYLPVGRERFDNAVMESLHLVKWYPQEHAQEGRTGLVVMGSHGRGFIGELFVGSVSHNVARHAEAPVLLVPMPQKGNERS